MVGGRPCRGFFDMREKLQKIKKGFKELHCKEFGNTQERIVEWSSRLIEAQAVLAFDP